MCVALLLLGGEAVVEEEGEEEEGQGDAIDVRGATESGSASEARQGKYGVSLRR